jgi:hypothetical protein
VIESVKYGRNNCLSFAPFSVKQSISKLVKAWKAESMRNHRVATIFVTLYLLVYVILHQTGAELRVLAWMFVFSPALVIWMVYTILKYGIYSGPELAEQQEYGYQDKQKEDLGTF